mgnify:CR=1 FL=1
MNKRTSHTAKIVKRKGTVAVDFEFVRANFKGPRDFVWTALAPLSYYAFVWQHGYISPRPFVDYYSTGEAACEWCGNSHQLTLHGCLADCKGARRVPASLAAHY